MKAEDALISAILRGGGVRQAMKYGVTRNLFLTRRAEWRYLEQNPNVRTSAFRARFPEFRVYKVSSDELEAVIHTVQEERANFELGKLFQRNQRLFGEIEPLELAKRVSKETDDILRKYNRGEDIDLIADHTNILQFVRARKSARKGKSTIGWPIGIPTLDELFGGINSPDMWAIVARQGEMKTWLSLFMATTALEAGAKVMYVSLEMSVEQVALRVHTLLSRLLSKSYSDQFKTVFSNRALMMGTVNIKQYRQWLLKARSRLKNGFIIPDSNTSQSIEQLRGKLEEHKPDILFYDYFGLAIGEGRVENWMEAEQFSHGFKALAKEYNIPVIVNAQANRAGAQDKDAPKLEHIAYTDSIGRDSDRILTLRTRGGELTVNIAKNRFGPTGKTIRLDTDIDKGVLDEIVMGSRNISRRGRFSDEEAD